MSAPISPDEIQSRPQERRRKGTDNPIDDVHSGKCRKTSDASRRKYTSVPTQDDGNTSDSFPYTPKPENSQITTEALQRECTDVPLLYCPTTSNTLSCTLKTGDSHGTTEAPQRERTDGPSQECASDSFPCTSNTGDSPAHEASQRECSGVSNKDDTSTSDIFPCILNNRNSKRTAQTAPTECTLVPRPDDASRAGSSTTCIYQH